MFCCMISSSVFSWLFIFVYDFFFFCHCCTVYIINHVNRRIYEISELLMCGEGSYGLFNIAEPHHHYHQQQCRRCGHRQRHFPIKSHNESMCNFVMFVTTMTMVVYLIHSDGHKTSKYTLNSEHARTNVPVGMCTCEFSSPNTFNRHFSVRPKIRQQQYWSTIIYYT